MGLPFRRHWKLSGAVPAAAALKVAAAGAMTTWAWGWPVTAAATWTVRVAPVLVVVPATLLTRTAKTAPSSAAPVAGVL